MVSSPLPTRRQVYRYTLNLLTKGIRILLDNYMETDKIFKPKQVNGY
jgi:hypothetical protein